jgi:hypothetical protein
MNVVKRKGVLHSDLCVCVCVCMSTCEVVTPLTLYFMFIHNILK